MRKIITLLAVVMTVMLLSLDANAKGKGGGLVKAGYTTSNMGFSSIANIPTQNLSGFHVGIGYQSGKFLGFAFQPELIYNIKGTRLMSPDGKEDLSAYKTSSIELPINIQWGIDFIAFRPYLQVSPYIGYNFGARNSTIPEVGDISLNPLISEIFSRIMGGQFEYGVGFGGGLELVGRLQISAKYIMNLANYANINNLKKEYSEAFKDKTYMPGAVEVSVAFLF